MLQKYEQDCVNLEYGLSNRILVYRTLGRGWILEQDYKKLLLRREILFWLFLPLFPFWNRRLKLAVLTYLVSMFLKIS